MSTPTGKYICCKAGKFAECVGCRHADEHDPYATRWVHNHIQTGLRCNQIPRGETLWCSRRIQSLGIPTEMVCISVLAESETVNNELALTCGGVG